MHSEQSPWTVQVGMAAQVIGAVLNVQFDGRLHPTFECIESTGLEVRCRGSELGADDPAQSGA